MPKIQKAPVLRLACQWCNCGKYAIHYTDHRDGQLRVCLVCPRCDSGAVE